MALNTLQLDRVLFYLKSMDCFESSSGSSGKYFLTSSKVYKCIRYNLIASIPFCIQQQVVRFTTNIIVV